MEKCPDCKGTTICDYCDGTGRIDNNPYPSDPHVLQDGTGTSKCIVCSGSGKCSTCGGTGYVAS